MAAAFAFGAGVSGALFFLLAARGRRSRAVPDRRHGVLDGHRGRGPRAGASRAARRGAVGVAPGAAGCLPRHAPAPGLIARVSAGLQGDWDAWAIWNLRARFLIEPTDRWKDAFVPALTWAHPNYPMHLPSAVARGWLQAGSESVTIPIWPGRGRHARLHRGGHRIVVRARGRGRGGYGSVARRLSSLHAFRHRPARGRLGRPLHGPGRDLSGNAADHRLTRGRRTWRWG